MELINQPQTLKQIRELKYKYGNYLKLTADLENEWLVGGCELPADALGNLYRSALFMTKGQTRLSKTFLEKTYRVLGKKLPKQIVYFMKKKESLTKKQQLYWAEKILDCYHLLKNTYLLP